MSETNFKEKRIRTITISYYSREDIKKAIFEFSQDRETIPRYFEGFGKRPDVLEYESDIFELAKKGATSFHCSQELWENPREISTNLTKEQFNELRKGWDLLIDIDSKYLDYSKIATELIIEALKFNGIKNIGLKFSVVGNTPILIRRDNKIKLLSISKVIDLFKKDKKIEVLSLDKNKKLKFSKIYDYLKHKDKLYEIYHTQSKIPIKTTGHHSVFIWDKGAIIKKKVKDIKEGNFLITFNLNNNPFESKNLEIINKFQLGRNKYSKKIINRKIKLTSDLMRLIGYFLAEGHVTNIINQVGFSFNKNEEEYISDVKNLLSSITKRRISIRHPNPNSTQILIHSKEWATFFDNFCGKKKDKHLPNFSWTLPKELFLEMLKGYIRGDGYKIGKYAIIIKSVSQKLITELVWLCNLYGISCSLSKEKNKSRLMPQGTEFKGNLVYIIKIPKSEISFFEFNRPRNKFSPFPRDKTFPIDGLKQIYYQIKPKMFNYHRCEQMTLKKKCANLNRIKKVLNWFSKFGSIKANTESKKILSNYNLLFNSDIGVVEIKKIIKKEKESFVYDISVEETESFFGNYYPILLHNSGSKGFHIIVPWKAFPKEVAGVKVKNMFPKYPRIICEYLTELIKPKLIDRITELTHKGKSHYIKDFEVPKKVMPDIILVSPRHLFRMPYSLHEKTALSSAVLFQEQLANFQPSDANPLKVKVKNFMPDSEENEAKELLTQALDWYKENKKDEKMQSNIKRNFQQIKIKNLSPKNYPPCINKILLGVKDGRKRALFILINFFRALGQDRNTIEEIIEDWNKKNEKPLKQGYIKSQFDWTFRQKILLPPNCDKPHYRDIGVCSNEIKDNFCRLIKNPVNYTVRKSKSYKKTNKNK